MKKIILSGLFLTTLLMCGCGISVGNTIEQSGYVTAQGVQIPKQTWTITAVGEGENSELAKEDAHEEVIRQAGLMGVRIAKISGPTQWQSTSPRPSSNAIFTGRGVYQLTGYAVGVSDSQAQAPLRNQPHPQSQEREFTASKQQTFQSTIIGYGTGKTLQEAENSAFEDMARKARLLNMNVVAVSNGRSTISAAKSPTTKPLYAGMRTFMVTTSSAQCTAASTEPSFKINQTPEN